MSDYKFIPFEQLDNFPSEEMEQRSMEFNNLMQKRRTIRDFSDKSISIETIRNCINAAGSAPSGANMQPWHFAVVADPKIKKEIRIEAEKEETAFYSGRAPEEWLDALKQFGTDHNKPFLETAPYLIVLFEVKYHVDETGKKVKHYYTKESIGIAAGMLITALHNAGISTLTHTPSPMNFLNKILGRPENEKPFLLLVAGFAAEDALVPDISRKPIEDITSFY